MPDQGRTDITSILFDFDKIGNLYSANEYDNTIVKMDFNLNLLGVLKDKSIITPKGIAFDNSYGYLYVCNYSNNNIQRI